MEPGRERLRQSYIKQIMLDFGIEFNKELKKVIIYREVWKNMILINQFSERGKKN